MATRISIIEYYVQWHEPLPEDAYELMHKVVEGREKDILSRFNRLLDAVPSFRESFGHDPSAVESLGNGLHIVLKVLGLLRPAHEVEETDYAEIPENQLDMDRILFKQSLFDLRSLNLDRLLDYLDVEDITVLLYYLQRMPRRSIYINSFLARLLLSNAWERLHREDPEITSMLRIRICNIIAALRESEC